MLARSVTKWKSVWQNNGAIYEPHESNNLTRPSGRMMHDVSAGFNADTLFPANSVFDTLFGMPFHVTPRGVRKSSPSASILGQGAWTFYPGILLLPFAKLKLRSR